MNRCHLSKSGVTSLPHFKHRDLQGESLCLKSSSGITPAAIMILRFSSGVVYSRFFILSHPTLHGLISIIDWGQDIKVEAIFVVPKSDNSDINPSVKT